MLLVDTAGRRQHAPAGDSDRKAGEVVGVFGICRCQQRRVVFLEEDGDCQISMGPSGNGFVIHTKYEHQSLRKKARLP